MKKPWAAIPLLLSTSCASIVASSTDRLRVHASPPTSQVVLNGEVQGSASMSIDVPRRGRNSIQVQAPGYKTASCSSSMSAGGKYVAADVILCALLFPIGCISFIDANGAWNTLDSSECHVSLIEDTKTP